MAVWGQRRYIVIPLTLVILGHWSLLLEGGRRLCVSCLAYRLTYRCCRYPDEGQVGPGVWMHHLRDYNQASIRYIHICDVRRLHSAVPNRVSAPLAFYWALADRQNDLQGWIGVFHHNVSCFFQEENVHDGNLHCFCFHVDSFPM